MYKSARHLDQKHTVFGKVVGGIDVLRKMELIPVGERDKPIEDIKILATVVISNPFSEESMLKEQQEIEARKQKKNPTADKGERGLWFSHPQPVSAATSSSSVGKYLPEAALPTVGSKRPALDFGAVSSESPTKKAKTSADPFSRF